MTVAIAVLALSLPVTCAWVYVARAWFKLLIELEETRVRAHATARGESLEGRIVELEKRVKLHTLGQVVNGRPGART